MPFEDHAHFYFISAVILVAFIHGTLLASILAFNKELKSKSSLFLALAIFTFSDNYNINSTWEVY